MLIENFTLFNKLSVLSKKIISDLDKKTTWSSEELEWPFEVKLHIIKSPDTFLVWDDETSIATIHISVYEDDLPQTISLMIHELQHLWDIQWYKNNGSMILDFSNQLPHYTKSNFKKLLYNTYLCYKEEQRARLMQVLQNLDNRGEISLSQGLEYLKKDPIYLEYLEIASSKSDWFIKLKTRLEDLFKKTVTPQIIEKIKEKTPEFKEIKELRKLDAIKVDNGVLEEFYKKQSLINQKRAQLWCKEVLKKWYSKNIITYLKESDTLKKINFNPLPQLHEPIKINKVAQTIPGGIITGIIERVSKKLEEILPLEKVYLSKTMAPNSIAKWTHFSFLLDIDLTDWQKDLKKVFVKISYNKGFKNRQSIAILNKNSGNKQLDIIIKLGPNADIIGFKETLIKLVHEALKNWN
jgi:hypothetical protein